MKITVEQEIIIRRKPAKKKPKPATTSKRSVKDEPVTDR